MGCVFRFRVFTEWDVRKLSVSDCVSGAGQLARFIIPVCLEQIT